MGITVVANSNSDNTVCLVGKVNKPVSMVEVLWCCVHGRTCWCCVDGRTCWCCVYAGSKLCCVAGNDMY